MESTVASADNTKSVTAFDFDSDLDMDFDMIDASIDQHAASLAGDAQQSWFDIYLPTFILFLFVKSYRYYES